MSTVEQEPGVGCDVSFDQMRKYLKLRAEIKSLEELASQIRKEWNEIGEKLIEQFALNGVQSLNVDGSCVYLSTDKYASAKAECREAIVAWARENDLDDMIVVQPQRFAAWCREAMKQDEFPAELEGMVTTFEKTNLRVRNA